MHTYTPCCVDVVQLASKKEVVGKEAKNFGARVWVILHVIVKRLHMFVGYASTVDVQSKLRANFVCPAGHAGFHARLNAC